MNYGKLVRQLLLDGLGGESLHVLDPGALPFVDAAMTGAITCFQMGAAPSSMRVRRVGSVADLGALDKGRAIGRMRPARAAAGHRSGLAGRPEGARSCQNLEWIIPGIVEVLIPRKGEGSCLHPGSTLMSSRTARSGWCLGCPGRSGSAWGCFRRVGDELGVNPETLRGWVRQARIDAGEGPGTTTEGARRTGELALEVREPGAGGAIGRSASACL